MIRRKEKSNWKDLLTAYNGHPITYDAIGNPRCGTTAALPVMPVSDR